MAKDRARIGWVVDAQHDFMDPEGRLYVREGEEDPGAVQVLGNLERAVAWMRAHCDLVVFTGDWHGLEDEEIDAENPDPANGTFPPHCMGRSDDPEERRGAEVIPEIRPDHPVILDLDATADDAEAVVHTARAEGREIFIRKDRFDVFEGNPSTEALLHALELAFGRPLEFIVAGVARDVCVTQAVDGLQVRDYPVRALADATWGLGLEPEEETLLRWSARGRVIRTGELLREE